MRAFLESCWYRDSPWCYLLAPVSLLFLILSGLRRWAYRTGLLAQTRLPVPVIVVGNITVGGTGKTPLVIWLAETLRASGYRPGVISRGYGGRQKAPAQVTAGSDPMEVGDEPVLISRLTGCPTWIGRRRAETGSALLASNPAVDVLISDDGLQHYALARDVEIVMVDGGRALGNGWPLPLGPLREPARRLASVDAVVINGGPGPHLPGTVPVFTMRLEPARIHAVDDWSRTLSVADLLGHTAHALAGIGHPERFFAMLGDLGIRVIAHPFPDHHVYRAADVPDGTVVMTEKDAVKCAAYARDDLWCIEVDATPEVGLKTMIIHKLKGLHGLKAA